VDWSRLPVKERAEMIVSNKAEEWLSELEIYRQQEESRFG
jgi:hypothetical protein